MVYSVESKFYSLATREVLQWKIKYLVTICSSVLRPSPNTSAKTRARPFTSSKRNSFPRLSCQGVQSGGRASLRCRSTLSGSSRAGDGDGHRQATRPKNRGRLQEGSARCAQAPPCRPSCYDWIADSTPWIRKPDSHGSAREAVEEVIRFYRERLWDEISDASVEVWCE